MENPSNIRGLFFSLLLLPLLVACATEAAESEKSVTSEVVEMDASLEKNLEKGDKKRASTPKKSSKKGKAEAKKESPALLAEQLEEGLGMKYNADHPRIKAQIKQFEAQNVTIFNHLDEERLVIVNYIIEELKRRDMPTELAFIPLIESSYRPNASNQGRHVGLWQLGGPTARVFGVKVEGEVDGRYNIKEATDAALTYLEYLNKMFDGDWLLTMAAYNAGEGRVLRSVKSNRAQDKKADYWSINLPPVTEAYIPKVLALSQMALEEERLQVPLEEIPKLVAVEVEDLDRLKLAVNNPDSIKLYNPKLTQKSLDHHEVLLPESVLNQEATELVVKEIAPLLEKGEAVTELN